MTKDKVMDIMIKGAEEVKKAPDKKTKKKIAEKTIEKAEKEIQNQQIEAPVKKKKSPELKIVPFTPVKNENITIKKEMFEKEVNEFSHLEIDYTIEETTMYAVNWFYLRRKFIDFCNFLIYPWVWFYNKIVDKPSIKIENKEEVDNMNNSIKHVPIPDFKPLSEDENKRLQAKIIKKDVDRVLTKKEDLEWQNFSNPEKDNLEDLFEEPITPVKTSKKTVKKTSIKTPEIYESDK